MQDTDEGLTGGQALGDFTPKGLLLDPFNEGPYHRKRYIRFEQGHPDLTQGLPNIVFGNTPAAPEGIEGPAKPR